MFESFSVFFCQIFSSQIISKTRKTCRSTKKICFRCCKKVPKRLVLPDWAKWEQFKFLTKKTNVLCGTSWEGTQLGLAHTLQGKRGLQDFLPGVYKHIHSKKMVCWWNIAKHSGELKPSSKLILKKKIYPWLQPCKIPYFEIHIKNLQQYYTKQTNSFSKEQNIYIYIYIYIYMYLKYF